MNNNPLGVIRMERFTRVSHNIDIMGGKACISGTRVTVSMILTRISNGKTIEELIKEYPYITRDDIEEALMYAAWAVEAREVVIASA